MRAGGRGTSVRNVWHGGWSCGWERGPSLSAYSVTYCRLEQPLTGRTPPPRSGSRDRALLWLTQVSDNWWGLASRATRILKQIFSNFWPALTPTPRSRRGEPPPPEQAGHGILPGELRHGDLGGDRRPPVQRPRGHPPPPAGRHPM